MPSLSIPNFVVKAKQEAAASESKASWCCTFAMGMPKLKPA
jgi:hypothetical protein